MVLIRQRGYIRAKLVIFRQRSCIRENWLYSGKVVALGHCGCIRAKVVVIGQKWLYSGKVVVFGRGGCIQANWLYAGKVVVFGQKWLYSG